MRTSTILLTVVAIGLCTLPCATLQAQQAGPTSFEAAGTDARHAQAFLAALQNAVALDNRLKVAAAFSYPVEVWAGGQMMTVRGESELHANYARIFDAALKQAIADAKADALLADAKGVMLGNGRVAFAPVGPKKALKITRINEPAK